MDEKELDLSNMTIDDLFQAKNQRRRRLAELPFERKIEIVQKFNAIVREALREEEQRRSEFQTESIKPK